MFEVDVNSAPGHCYVTKPKSTLSHVQFLWNTRLSSEKAELHNANITLPVIEQVAEITTYSFSCCLGHYLVKWELKKWNVLSKITTLKRWKWGHRESDSQQPRLCARGKQLLWVCGQRNAAHIFAIAAVEVMRSHVGACRGERTSLFCINNRMSYCCTNWAVFYWAGVSAYGKIDDELHHLFL